MRQDVGALVRPEVAAMRPYVPGLSVGQLGARLIKLNQNENPLGPSPKALVAARRALLASHRYPEGTSAELRAELAARWGMEDDWILVGNGSDEVFRLLAEVYLRPGDRVVIPAPSFAGYRLVAELMGAGIDPVPLAADGAMDLEAMARAARPSEGRPSARLVFLCRPNNPTGGVFSPEAFERFLAQVPEDSLVVLDEAYREYDVTEFAARPFLLRHPNLVVTRTFSKIYGLAGLRVGYGVGRPELWRPLHTARDPFSVNVVGQSAALAALGDAAHLARSQEINRAGREALTRWAQHLGVRAYPSQANFVLLDFGRPARPVYEHLLERGVAVRLTESFDLPHCLRVTVAKPSQMERLAAALRQALH